MEKAARPQSCFLQEERRLRCFFFFTCGSLSGYLAASQTPQGVCSQGRREWGRATTLNTLLRGGAGTREGHAHLRARKIYTRAGCFKGEWICGGRLVNSDLTKWRERDSLHPSARTHTHTGSTAGAPSWDAQALKRSHAHGRVTPLRMPRQTASPAAKKIYGRPVDCVNQIIPKSIILV